MKLKDTGLTAEELKDIVKKYMVETYARYDFIAERAEGMYLYDEKGVAYLDFYGGVAVNTPGNRNPKVVAAVEDQLDDIMHTFNYPYTIPQALLAKKICDTIGMDKIFFFLAINCRGKIHNVSNQDQIANYTPCTNRYHGNKRCNYVLQEHKKEQRIESPCDRTLQTDDPPVVKWLLMVIPPDLTENALHHKCRQKFQRRCKKRSQEKQQYTIVAIRT